MLVVFDTNVIISALYSKNGASFRLLRAALAGELSYALSPLIAWEYEGQILRKTAQGFLKGRNEDYERLLDAICAIAVPTWDPFQIRPILGDVSDDKILECAIASRCSHIITFNKRDFPATITVGYGIEVMTPGEFLRTWRAQT